MQRGQLRRVIRLQHRHDVLQHLGFHLHDVLEPVDKAHLKIHRRVFVQVALRVVLLRAEHRTDFKHALVNRHHRLLVKLRALRQIRAAAEVFHAEQVCAALRVLGDDLRGMDFRKALFLQRLAETADNALLNLEHRALAEVAQRHKAQRQIRVERQVHLVFADRHGHGLRRAGEYPDALRVQLYAARRALVAHRLAADRHRVAVANVFSCAQHALQNALRHSQQREAHVAQVAQGVHQPVHRRLRARFHRQHLIQRAVPSFGFACHCLHRHQPSFRPHGQPFGCSVRFFPKEKPPRTDSFCSGRDRVYAYPAVPPKLLPAAITRQPLSSLTRINRMRLGDCVGAPARECSFRPRGFCAWLSAGGHASLVENAGYSSLSLPFLLWMDGIIAHPHEAVKRFLSISFQNQLNSIGL